MIQNISDNLLFKGLRLIKYGHLKLTNYDGKKYCFGGIFIYDITTIVKIAYKNNLVE